MNNKNYSNEEEIIQAFLKKNPIRIGNKKNPYLILFDGITGTGKSTISKLLFEKLDIVVLNNDKVRQFIYTTSYSNNLKDRQELTKKIQNYRLFHSLKNGNNCILDGDISNNFFTKISNIKKYDITYYIIKINYDRVKVMERIKNRKFERDKINDFSEDETINYSNANIDDFLRMESVKFNIPKSEIFFEIDTTGSIDDIDKQVDTLVKKLIN